MTVERDNGASRQIEMCPKQGNWVWKPNKRNLSYLEEENSGQEAELTEEQIKQLEKNDPLLC